MKATQCAIGILFSSSRKSTQKRLVRNYMKISSWAGTLLHIVTLDPNQKETFCDFLEVLQRLSPEFIMLENDLYSKKTLHSAHGNMEKELLRKISIPIFVFTGASVSQIKSFYVPISGKSRTSRALEFAIHLANRIHSEVHLVHVTPSDCATPSEVIGIASTGDEACHEYSLLLDRIVSKTSPRSGIVEKQRVTDLHHLYGKASREILSLLKKNQRSLLVLEWNGDLTQGRAGVFRSLLKQAHSPIFIVKMAPERHCHLKIPKIRLVA